MKFRFISALTPPRVRNAILFSIFIFLNPNFVLGNTCRELLNNLISEAERITLIGAASPKDLDKSSTAEKTVSDRLFDQLNALELSEQRHSPQAYEAFIADISRQEAELLKRKSALEEELIKNEKELRLRFDWISRTFWPFGKLAVFKKVHITPLRDEILTINHDLFKLGEVKDEAEVLLHSVSGSPHIFNARAIYNAAEENKFTSAAFARILLSYKGDLRNKIKATSETFSKLFERILERTGDEGVADFLALSLLSRNILDAESMTRILRLYGLLNNKYDKMTAVHLAFSFHAARFEPKEIQKWTAEFDRIVTETEISGEALAAVFAVVISKNKKIEEVQEVVSLAQTLFDTWTYENEGYESSSVIAVGLYLKDQHKNPTAAENAVEIFRSVYDLQEVWWREFDSALITLAFVSRGEDTSGVTRAYDIFYNVSALPYIPLSESAAITASILITEKPPNDPNLSLQLQYAIDSFVF